MHNNISKELENLLRLIVSEDNDNFELGKLLLPNYADELKTYIKELNNLYISAFNSGKKELHNIDVNKHFTLKSFLELFSFYNVWFPNIPFWCVNMFELRGHLDFFKRAIVVNHYNNGIDFNWNFDSVSKKSYGAFRGTIKSYFKNELCTEKWVYMNDKIYFDKEIHYNN